jgi:general secretion pathway protein L
MIKLDTRIEIDIRGFFKWWFAELSAMVPAWLRKIVTESYDYLLVRSCGDDFHLSLVTEEPGKEFSGLELSKEGGDAWFQMVSHNPDLQKTPIVLRLDADQALVRVVTLPSAAESNLYQVVGYEMERLTPFRVDQIYYDVRLAEKLPERKQIKAELVLVPRSNLDAMLKRMESLGLVPGRVDVATTAESDHRKPKLRYNLLPQKLHDRPDHRKRLINGCLAVLLAGLIALMAALPLWMKRSYLAELDIELERERKIANTVQNLKKDADAMLRESDFLLRKKSTELAIVEILNELSMRIPDDTWLIHVSYRNPKLQIHGQSPSASALIEVLEASPFFKDTSFTSPVSQDRISGLERFQIATSVVPRDESDQAAQ